MTCVTFLGEFIREDDGQDLIEYALMAGLVAVAAGATLPPVANSVSTIFSKVESVIATIP